MDVGLYVDRISELSVKDVSWTAEFYIWFRWKGDTLRLKDAFQVVDGAIESQFLEVERLDGDRHYERYRVMATMTKSFDVSRISFAVLSVGYLSLNFALPLAAN